MAQRVQMNSAEIQKMLNGEGRYSGVRDDLTARMERALDYAVTNAPEKTGNFKDGLELRQDTTDRAVVRLVGTAPHSHLVETQSGILARALDEATGE